MGLFALGIQVGLGAIGCAPEVEATLVALPACGLDHEKPDSLQIVARGEFPAAEVRTTFASAGTVRIPELPQGAVALTVEGKVGDLTVAVGRTARLQSGDLPVYFAPEDRLCEVAADIPARDIGAVAVGPVGDVVIVGGCSPGGIPLADVVHTRDVDPQVQLLADGLQGPRTGMALVSIGGRRFVALGGLGSGPDPDNTWTEIDFDRSAPVGDPSPLPGHVDPRAFHGAAHLGNGRVLVAGGCDVADAPSPCVPAFRRVLDSSYIVDFSASPPTIEPAPSLRVPRCGLHLLVARDGVVFAVGGRGNGGRGVITVEQWRPGRRNWTPYGPTVAQEQRLQLGVAEAIVGATLLEGGLIVVVLNNGQVGWISEATSGRWPGWCDPADPGVRCFDQPQGNLDGNVDGGTGGTTGSMLGSGGDTAGDTGESPGDEGFLPGPRDDNHGVLALTDERIVVDSWILPVALLEQGAEDGIFLADPALGADLRGPRAKVATSPLPLADGTALLVGGREPGADTVSASSPLLFRLRPALGGPDERIPAIDLLEPGSFVLHHPGRISVQDKRLTFLSKDGFLTFPNVWAHVRGFRGAQFRFDVTLTGSATPHIILSQGAVHRMAIGFAKRITGTIRQPDGTPQSFTCGGEAPDFDKNEVPLRIEVAPQSIVISSGGQVLARCPGAGDEPVAIGLGASNVGSLDAYDMRLTRI